METDYRVKEARATILRAGAFKPRTSPYSFQGLGEKGLKILVKAREETGMPIVTEALGIEELPLVNEYADMSREYIAHWQQQVRSLGEEPASDSTVRGKVYRVWMDVKSAVTNHDRESILNSCAFGEKAAIDAYEDALSTNTHLPDEYRLAIVDQKSKLQAAHNKIEMYANVNEKIG